MAEREWGKDNREDEVKILNGQLNCTDNHNKIQYNKSALQVCCKGMVLLSTVLTNIYKKWFEAV